MTQKQAGFYQKMSITITLFIQCLCYQFEIYFVLHVALFFIMIIRWLFIVFITFSLFLWYPHRYSHHFYSESQHYRIYSEQQEHSNFVEQIMCKERIQARARACYNNLKDTITKFTSTTSIALILNQCFCHSFIIISYLISRMISGTSIKNSFTSIFCTRYFKHIMV